MSSGNSDYGWGVFAMVKRWYFSSQGQTYGPLEPEDIKARAALGELSEALRLRQPIWQGIVSLRRIDSGHYLPGCEGENDGQDQVP